MKIRTEKVIDVSEFDALVSTTYNKPYFFQQQDGCKSRGNVYIEVPSDGYDYPNSTVPEIVNHEQMGVSFKAWLERDPKQQLPKDGTYQPSLSLWWGRNFYPHVDMIINDLHSKGLLDAGKYTIDIDW